MRHLVEVRTFVGPLRFIWDDDAIGTDAHGRACHGAVTKAVIGRRLSANGAVRATRPTGDLAEVVRAVRRWNDGDADALNPVPVLQTGSEFRQRVWQALRAVPGGDVISYAELATRAGYPGATRAVGTAMAQNAVAPFVPCHRVVRTGGELGNYAYGVDMKASMLQREGLIVE